MPTTILFSWIQTNASSKELLNKSQTEITLTDYEGIYENGSTLIMVAGPNNKLLYASINENLMIQADGWAGFMLDLPMKYESGTLGSYCSGNVILVGKIIEKITGKTLKEYDAIVVLKGGGYNKQSHTKSLLSKFIIRGLKL